MEIDLDINNYDLVDILKLFNLDYEFDKNDLKHAKKITLMTHPDKSGMDKKYFLFFSAAYKALYEIYNFRHKRTNQSINYNKNEFIDEEKDNFLKLLEDKKQFNLWFNELFEKTMIRDDYTKTGYGDWLISDNDLDNRTTTMENMNNMFEKKKTELKAIVVHNDFKELDSTSLYELTNSKPESYSSDVFSRLPYEDLKKAHAETVIPVTMEDYNNKKKYKNMNELQQERSLINRSLPSHQQHQQYLDEKKRNEAIHDTERAYRLIQNDIQMEKVNKKWWGNLMRLTNK